MKIITIKDFMNNNENVPIMIESKLSRDVTDSLSKEVWKGMLYDVPVELHNYEVIQEGYGLISQCNVLTILEKNNLVEKKLYIVGDHNGHIYAVKAETKEKAINLINNYTGLNKEDWIVNLADNDNGEIIE